MSRGHMDHLKNSKFVAQTVAQHKRIRKILKGEVTATQDTVCAFIDALVKIEFGKVYTGDVGTHVNTDDDNLEYIARREEQALKKILPFDHVNEIKFCAIEIAQASIQLNSKKTGIGFAADKDLGTDQHVFGILGPHTGAYYGDIIIVFKRELMQHPDANFSPLAATIYKSGKAPNFHPWLTGSGTDSGRIAQFHASKLHCSEERKEAIRSYSDNREV
ncbi:unnamed protein product [Rotaria sp. Silwood1]|nr:unnamed protein product [Rotaria sp. Silwood1]CAF1509023.1 unnamed protein product [Rotaria sp. Silwood1]CAF3655475.1 unnamed protein product [Rotaria sp. Silwood1]CAF3669449.1 unnamed protein product [Rotaria sp. Silwood1]CAF3703694.1 unnamed protein product [Rotaria sp. Silwood1]